eukprot:624575-Rhodomonas_salina.1
MMQEAGSRNHWHLEEFGARSRERGGLALSWSGPQTLRSELVGEAIKAEQLEHPHRDSGLRPRAESCQCSHGAGSTTHSPRVRAQCEGVHDLHTPPRALSPLTSCTLAPR